MKIIVDVSDQDFQEIVNLVNVVSAARRDDRWTKYILPSGVTIPTVGDIKFEDAVSLCVLEGIRGFRQHATTKPTKHNGRG